MKKLLLLLLIVIITTPIYATSKLLSNRIDSLADEFGRIAYLNTICNSSANNLHKYFTYLVSTEKIFWHQEQNMARNYLKGYLKQKTRYSSCTIKAKMSMYIHQTLIIARLQYILPGFTKIYIKNINSNIFSP